MPMLHRILSCLALVIAADTALAGAPEDCQNDSLAAEARRPACDAALEGATDPLERAKLLVSRAETHNVGYGIVEPDEALADLAEAERLAPDMDPKLRADLLVQRSAIHTWQRDFETALADIDEAERLAPKDADPVVNRAVLLLEQGDQDAAMAQLARALDLEPDHVTALLSLTYELADTGEFQACVEHASKAAEIAPQDPNPKAFRGRCLAELGRTDEALADLKEAERLAPAEAFFFADLTWTYLDMGRADDALAAARRAVEIDPSNERGQRSLISALVAAEAPDEAIAAYRDAQAAGIGGPPGEMANDLAWNLYLEGYPEEALPIIEEGLAEQTEPDPFSVDTHAHILAAQGRADEAVQAFLRAAELSPEELRPMYEERLTALGFKPEAGEAGQEAALRACVATGEACKLYPQE